MGSDLPRRRAQGSEPQARSGSRSRAGQAGWEWESGTPQRSPRRPTLPAGGEAAHGQAARRALSNRREGNTRRPPEPCKRCPRSIRTLRCRRLRLSNQTALETNCLRRPRPSSSCGRPGRLLARRFAPRSRSAGSRSMIRTPAPNAHQRSGRRCNAEAQPPQILLSPEGVHASADLRAAHGTGCRSPEDGRRGARPPWSSSTGAMAVAIPFPVPAHV